MLYSTTVAPIGTILTSAVHAERSARASRRLDWIACGALMALAAAFRAYLLHTVFAHIDSDQAILGLMAYHIQAGNRPVFFYGQPYQGSLEAYLAALVFSLWGATEWTVRVPALAFSTAWVGALYWLSTILYGRRIAVLAGLFVALGPAILLDYGTVAGAGYIEAMLCGTLLLLLAVRYPDLRIMPLAAALACGLLAGLGVWMQPMTGEYLVPVVVAFAVRLLAGAREPGASGWRGLGRSLAAMAAGGALGIAPLLIYNLQHHWDTLAFLHSNAQGSDHLAVAERLVTEALPVLVGLITPTTVASVFAHLISSHPLQYWFGLIVGSCILARLIVDPYALPLRIAALGRPRGTPSQRRATHRPPWNHAGQTPWVTGRDGVLALFAVSSLLFFVLTSFGAMPWAARLPRYLIPLYTVTPLVLDCFIPRQPARLARWIAPVVVGVLIAAGVATTLSTEPRDSIAGLDHLLASQHVQVAYADYWLANRIAFQTHQQVISVPVTDALEVGQERIPGYLDVARHTSARHLAWIFVQGSAGEQRFRPLLRQKHVQARRTTWQGWVVYTDFSSALRAPLSP